MCVAVSLLNFNFTRTEIILSTVKLGIRNVVYILSYGSSFHYTKCIQIGFNK